MATTGCWIVGASGTGTLNVNNTGVVNVPIALCLGNAVGASGTVSLDGGTIIAYP